MDTPSDYTDHPTKARVYWVPDMNDEDLDDALIGGQWWLDGIDGNGGCTESVWHYERGEWAQAIADVPTFLRAARGEAM